MPTQVRASFRNRLVDAEIHKVSGFSGGKLQTVKKLLDLSTPCLLLDIERFEANLDKMSRFTKSHGVALRPTPKRTSA